MKTRHWNYGVKLLVGMALIGLAAGYLCAQTTGSISGYITDQSGAVMPSAKVTLQNEATGALRSTQTQINGFYNFPLLPPGSYRVTAEKAGFRKDTVTRVVVQVDGNVRHDFVLQVGRVTSQVSVTARPVQINRVTAALGQVIGARMIVALPLNGRDFLQLATLGAGVNPPALQNGQSVAQGFDLPYTTVVGISGVREVSADFLFDGIPSRHQFYGAVGLQPPVDSIAEFKIQQGYFSPQYGAPAVVNVVLKSGTNDIHGTAWEFLRNDALDTRNFFDTSQKSTLRQNQFGANAGGPVIKNKLFWFGDYEGLRIRSGSDGFYTVPTAAILSGDFSGLPAIDDPLTYNPATGTKQPFPGNVIPPDRISSFAKKYEQFIPAPNTVPIPSRANANLTGPVETTTNADKFDVKVDYVKSEKDTFMGRFSYMNSQTIGGSLVPDQAIQSPLNARNAVFGWTWIISPRTVNEFRAGLDRDYQAQGSPAPFPGQSNWPVYFGLTNLNQIPACNGIPNVSMLGLSGFGPGNPNCIIPASTDKLFLDNLSLVHGAHSITLGGELTRVNIKDIGSLGALGDFEFTGQYSGNAIADYLLGDPFVASGAKPSAPAYMLGWQGDLYINDDYHATRSLTLNLGLRWDVAPPLIEKYNHWGIFNPQTGVVDVAGKDGNSRGLIESHWADFAPRIGLAYSPTPNWSFRSSYGIFWTRVPGNDLLWNNIKAPFQLITTFIGDPNVPTINMATLFPSPSSTGAIPVGTSLFNYGPANRPDPYVQQWTSSIQRTLPEGLLLQVAYVGSHGVHLSKRIDLNLAPHPPAPDDTRPLQERRPYPQYGYILDDVPGAGSSYNALQVTLRKEFSNRWSLLTAYTYAHCLDNDSFDSRASRHYRPGDNDWGRCIDDTRHRFSTAVIYQLPGEHLNGFSHQLLGGWELDGILSLQTGLPFMVLDPIDSSNTGANFVSWARPNRVCDGNLPASQQTPEHWFNTACFVQSAQDTYGNAGVNYLSTDGLADLDLALVKSFPITERQRLEFRAEAFNSLNNVNFNQPGFVMSTPSFGQVLSSQPGRVIQFALKYSF